MVEAPSPKFGEGALFLWRFGKAQLSRRRETDQRPIDAYPHVNRVELPQLGEDEEKAERIFSGLASPQ